MATLRATAMGAASIPATHQMPAIDNLARSLDGRALQQYNRHYSFLNKKSNFKHGEYEVKCKCDDSFKNSLTFFEPP